MPRALQLLSVMLFMSFVACCMASALLQLIASLRHSSGKGLGFMAMWRPEGKFDEIGVYQMRLAKRLMLVGAVAYLSYGVLMMVMSQVNVRG